MILVQPFYYNSLNLKILLLEICIHIQDKMFKIFISRNVKKLELQLFLKEINSIF